MQLGPITPSVHDFAFHDSGNRPAAARTTSGHGALRSANGDLHRAERFSEISRTGRAVDSFRPTARAARLLDRAPLHSKAPGAADRIVEALGDDTELIDKFLQAIELLEPFGPGLVRAFTKAVARGIERAGEAAVPPEPAPVESPAAQEFSYQLTRIDFQLEVFSASSQLNSGPDGYSFTQNVQYANIRVSFLSLNISGSYSEEIDPLQIQIAGDSISGVGLESEAASNEGNVAAASGESFLAPGYRDAILDAAGQIGEILSHSPEGGTGTDDRAAVVPRQPESAAASVREIVRSLTQGFTPGIRLHN